MSPRIKTGLSWSWFLLALQGLTTAAGQMAPVATTSGSSVPPASMMANPYLNPYLNPYMSPIATQQSMKPGNALLYMYAANSANGGLGSGRLSGTRGGLPSRAKPAEMPNSAAHPGGGASRYFNPSPSSVSSGRYYNQRGRYFQNNGR